MHFQNPPRANLMALLGRIHECASYPGKAGLFRGIVIEMLETVLDGTGNTADVTGVTRGTVRSWVNGKSAPTRNRMKLSLMRLRCQLQLVIPSAPDPSATQEPTP